MCLFMPTVTCQTTFRKFSIIHTEFPPVKVSSLLLLSDQTLHKIFHVSCLIVG